jgi:hypothetical protein
MKRTDITLSKYADNLVEFMVNTGYGYDQVNVHKIGVDESGRATYAFDLPHNDEGDGTEQELAIEEIAFPGFSLESAKKEWPKATIEEILKVVNDKCKSDIGVEALEKFLSSHKVWPKSTIDKLAEALLNRCKWIGVPAPETLLAALAKATELVVTFDGQILEAGNEGKRADGSDKDDEDKDEDE